MKTLNRRVVGATALLLVILAVMAMRFAVADDDDHEGDWRYPQSPYGWYPPVPSPPVVISVPPPVIYFPPLPQVVIGFPPVVTGVPFRGGYPHDHGWHRGWHHRGHHGHWH